MNAIARVALVLLLVGVVSQAAAAEKAKSKTVQGKVTAVAADSLAIDAGGKALTFGIDNTTKVIGTGVGTKMKDMKAKNQPFTITDAVGAGDQVKVTYHEMNGAMHAATVNITQKSLTKP